MTESIHKIINKFLNTDYINIIDLLNRQIKDLMNVRNKTDEQLEYIKASKEILFTLQFGTKPNGLDNDEFSIVKPLIQTLVDKGQLKEEIMELFI